MQSVFVVRLPPLPDNLSRPKMAPEIDEAMIMNAGNSQYYGETLGWRWG